ncbi:MAG: PilX N-terminal domain-containing pilus assembly protein [Thermoanaerobaculia bacterium]
MHDNGQVPAGRGERGSAYVAVLVVLVVLTIFGLALALVTQTELQVGANERTISRVFYAADAGIELATATALVTSDHTQRSYLVTDSGVALVSGKVELGTRVDVSPFYPILDSPCNLCEINNAGAYNERAYRKINHAVTVRAARFATIDAGSNRTPVAQKLISAMVEVQPWKASPDAYAAANDPAALADIKF